MRDGDQVRLLLVDVEVAANASDVSFEVVKPAVDSFESPIDPRVEGVHALVEGAEAPVNAVHATDQCLDQLSEVFVRSRQVAALHQGECTIEAGSRRFLACRRRAAALRCRALRGSRHSWHLSVL